MEKVAEERRQRSALQEELVAARATLEQLSGSCSEASMASLPVSELERLQGVHLEGLQHTQRAMTRALREQNQVSEGSLLVNVGQYWCYNLRP